MKLLRLFAVPALLLTVQPAFADCYSRSDDNIADFRLALKVFHANDNGNPYELEDVVAQLCEAGTPEREAFRSVMAVVKEPRINPDARVVLQIVETARNFAAVRNLGNRP